MPDHPKPAPKAKNKKCQRVYVRYICGCYELTFRSEVGVCKHHDTDPDKIYSVGVKYITEHGALVDLLDAICSKMVVHRDGYQCVLCGSRIQPQNGHVIVRGKWGTRWNLKNQNCQCSACNIRHGKAQQAHYYINWFIQKWGHEEWWKLCEQAEGRRFGKDWTVIEMQELLEYYEALFERMETLSVFDDSTIRELGLYG